MTIAEELLESNGQFLNEAASFPEVLRRERPKEGAFSATEIICHMVAVERLWEKRFTKLLTEGSHMFEVMNPDAVAIEERHNEESYEQAMEHFRTLRQETIARVEKFSDATLQLRGMHPRFGELSILSILEIMRKHDLQHMAQLERTRDLLHQRETA